MIVSFTPHNKLFCGLVSILFIGAQAYAASPAGSVFAPLEEYQGVWQVQRNDAPKPERLENHCVTLGAYFACGQKLNGKDTALLVFVSAGAPGYFHTQSILPEGRATGLDDLHISGSKWVFTSRRQMGGKVTYYRNTNVFTDKNHIQFESARSTDGKNWTVEFSGQESRLAK